MNSPTYQFAQYEDLLDLPDNIVANIIHGQLTTIQSGPDTQWLPE